MGHDMKAETISITGHGGDRIEAYLAQPLGAGRYGGVVIIHHMPGYDESMKEKARRFASAGYIACLPNLYSREAPGPRAGCRTSGWWVTLPGPPTTSVPSPVPTARWG